MDLIIISQTSLIYGVNELTTFLRQLLVQYYLLQGRFQYNPCLIKNIVIEVFILIFQYLFIDFKTMAKQ